jgi:hypothetical protein
VDPDPIAHSESGSRKVKKIKKGKNSEHHFKKSRTGGFSRFSSGSDLTTTSLYNSLQEDIFRTVIKYPI